MVIAISGHGRGAPSSRTTRGGLVAVALAAALAACNSTSEQTTDSAALGPVPAVPPITADELVGKWGLASFREEADLARTTAEARRYCNNPYVITKGPTGGVMMYLADQTQPSEVFVKNAGGRIYIGPAGPPGMPKDRQVTSFANGVMVAAWLDPSVTARYGTMVFVRCDAPPAPAVVSSAAPAASGIMLPPGSAQ